MNEGYIKLFRQLQENPAWLSEPFTRGQAWIDLLLLANHAYGYFYLRGNKIELQRGQLARSEAGLACRWHWSRGKLRAYLKQLEIEQQIEQQKSSLINKITIRNYDLYQKQDSRQDSRKPTESLQKDTNKKNKKNKNSIPIEELSLVHISDWLAEKRRLGKYTNVDENEVLEGFKDYCKSKNKTYDDYVAALRNAFKWEKFNKGDQNGTNQQYNKPNRAKQSITEAYNEVSAAIQRGEI